MIGSWRDHLAYRLARAALWLATPRYRRFCEGAWQYGLDAAARDSAKAIPAPPPWWTQEPTDG